MVPETNIRGIVQTKKIWTGLAAGSNSVEAYADDQRPRRAGQADHNPEASRAKNAPKAKKRANRAKATAIKAKKAAREPRPDSKKAIILGLMRRKGGATLAELMTATGWQKHSVQGFVNTVGKKMGLAVESSRNGDRERCYRIGR